MNHIKSEVKDLTKETVLECMRAYLHMNGLRFQNVLYVDTLKKLLKNGNGYVIDEDRFYKIVSEILNDTQSEFVEAGARDDQDRPTAFRPRSAQKTQTAVTTGTD